MKALPENHYAYNKQLQPVASKLRSQMTKSEACMWKYMLRAGQMAGYQFRRQRPVLSYVVDFMCKELMLVIELDGLYHGEPGVMVHDSIRQKAIEQAGFTVLRFTNADVLNNMKGVHIMLQEWIANYEQLYPDVKPSARYSK